MLAPANQVHTRSYKDDYFIVVAGVAAAAHSRSAPPVSALPAGPDHGQVLRLGDEAPQFERFRAGRRRARIESYKSDFLLLTTECLIRAIETRMDKRPTGVQESLAEGFILTPFFAEALPAYEKQESAMRLYFPELMATMDARKEIKRLDAADLTMPSAKRQRKSVERMPEPPRETGGHDASMRRRRCMKARELEKAAEMFRQALQQTDKKPLHARSYYGLGAHRRLQRNPELAEQLFRKTLELSPDPHTQAWSEVYLGRLALATAAPDDAAAHFKAALAVEGATDKAKQAAEEGLSKTSK